MYAFWVMTQKRYWLKAASSATFAQRPGISSTSGLPQEFAAMHSSW
jgi:hypothetical protein